MNNLKKIKLSAVSLIFVGLLFSVSLNSCGNKTQENNNESTVSTEAHSDSVNATVNSADTTEHPKGNDEHPKAGKEEEHPKKGNAGDEHPKK